MRLNWIGEVIERAKLAAARGPKPMLRGQVKHLRLRTVKEDTDNG